MLLLSGTLPAGGHEDPAGVGFEASYKIIPFRELLSRIRAVLRRARPPAKEEVIRIGPCSIDFGAHKVLLHGEEIILSPTEFNLFSYLVKKRGRVCTREQILDEVWGMDAFVEPRTVDVHIRRLRARIGTKTSSLIRTIRGVGYTPAYSVRNRNRKRSNHSRSKTAESVSRRNRFLIWESVFTGSTLPEPENSAAQGSVWLLLSIF